MYIKVTCSVLIIIFSWLGGLIVSRVYIDRVNELKQFEKLLFALFNQISYGMTPIPHAIKQIKRDTSYPMNSFLEYFDSGLALRNRTIEEVWKSSLLSIEGKLNLKREDKEIIIWFGKQLGNVDRETQLTNIQFTAEQIKKQREEAEESRDKKCRLYKSLGLALGMFISVIII